MTGDLNMDLKKISFLGTPTAALDAVPLYYASTKYLNLNIQYNDWKYKHEQQSNI